MLDRRLVVAFNDRVCVVQISATAYRSGGRQAGHVCSDPIDRVDHFDMSVDALGQQHHHFFLVTYIYARQDPGQDEEQEEAKAA